jgi:hypothetical protein
VDGPRYWDLRLCGHLRCCDDDRSRWHAPEMACGDSRNSAPIFSDRAPAESAERAIYRNPRLQPTTKLLFVRQDLSVSMVVYHLHDMYPAPAKDRLGRTGRGVLLIALGAIGLYTLFRPSPGMMRPDNQVQFATMLLVPLALAIWGVVIIVNGLRRH